MPRQGLRIVESGAHSSSSYRSPNSPIVDLPIEILLKIFRYFDPVFLVHTVSLVCKRFTTILKDDDYWRSSYYGLLKEYHEWESFPILERYGVLKEGWRCEPDIFWRDLTLKLKQMHDRWAKPIHSLKLHSSSETVDAVHILQNDLCLTGSREKCIDLWAIDVRPYIKSSVVEAHRGWISCFQSFENDYFLSGSWDSTISYWNIGPTTCDPVWTVECGKAVMSLAARPGLVVAGLFGNHIILIDPRIRQNMHSVKFDVHDKPVVSVKLMDNYVVSVGRDCRLCAFDLRLHSVVHRTNFRTQEPGMQPRNGMPLSMAVRNNIVYVGDSKGYMYLFDAFRSFEKFQKIPIHPREVGPLGTPRDYKVSSICPDLGAIIVGCSDHTVQVVVPTSPLYTMKTLEVEHEVTSMSYRRSILAVGKTNGAVDVFKADMQGSLTIVPL